MGAFVWRDKQRFGGLGRGSFPEQRGIPDLLGIWRGLPLAIEVKNEKGKVSPAQAGFLLKFEKAGGIAFVARSLDDVLKKLHDRR